VAILRIKTY